MKGRNTLLLKLTRNLFIAVLLIIICTTSGVYATDITSDDGTTTEPTVTTTLPYIEMKVKAIKVGESNQILVEMWGSNFTNLEAIEFVFTYNNTKLTPSNVSDNNIVENLNLYKYEKRPTQAGDKPTDLELLEQAEFDQNSTDALLKAFSFEDEYKDLLNIDLFRYLAPDKNNEAMQFIVSKKENTPDISATKQILLGKFSFRQTEGTTLEENELTTSRIKVSCDDGVTPGKESYYIRDITSKNEDEKDCTEIVEFTYEKYGSISGVIETGYFNGVEFEQIGKNIATIKLYNASDVAEFDWTAVGNTYKTNRLKLQPIVGGNYELCYRPDNNKKPEIEPVMEITTTEENLGSFKLDKVLFGEYVVVIDKLNYADYIIPGVVVDGTNKDIDLGNMQVEAGDLNKDGIIDKIDRTIFLRLYTNADNVEADLGIVAFDLNDDRNEGKNSEKVDRTYMLRILTNSLNREIKLPQKSS